MAKTSLTVPPITSLRRSRGLQNFLTKMLFDPTGVMANAPVQRILRDPSYGYRYFDHFHSYVAGDWTVTQATTGTAALGTGADAKGGVLLLDSNSITQGQGVNFQKINQMFTPAAGKHIWFETRIKVVDTFDKVELFAGLAALDTTLIATQALSAADAIGWKCVTNNGVLLFSGIKASAEVTKAAATIAEDTWIKLGFYVNGVTEIEQYVNDLLASAKHVTANIPIVALTPSFVCQTGGTNDPILHVDYIDVVQIY